MFDNEFQERHEIGDTGQTQVQLIAANHSLEAANAFW